MIARGRTVNAYFEVFVHQRTLERAKEAPPFWFNSGEIPMDSATQNGYEREYPQGHSPFRITGSIVRRARRPQSAPPAGPVWPRLGRG